MSDNAWLRLARMMPRKLRYWCVIVNAAEVTTRPPLDTAEVPSILLMDAIKEMEK